MTAVELLQTQVTQEQAVGALRGWILAAPSPPDAATLDTPGTAENAFLYGLALAEENRSNDRARYAQAAFRSTAPIEYLRLIAIEVFNLPVQVAGAATTTIDWTNTSGNAYGPYDVGELRVVNDSTQAVFENSEAVTIAAAQLSPFVAASGSFAIRAVETGTASNSAAGEIDRLETALEGVAVTNPGPALTVDDEDRDSINRRIDARIGLFGVAGANGLSSGGPATAVEAIARSGYDQQGGCIRADGSRIGVTRTRLVRDDATGISTLYVADNDGPIDLSDLPFVADEVTWYAERVCSRVDTENTTTTTITPVASITIRQTSLTNAQIVALVNAAMPSAALAVPIGGFDISPSPGVPLEYVEGAIRGALVGRVVLVNIAVSTPSGMTTMLESDILSFGALTTGTLTISRIA